MLQPEQFRPPWYLRNGHFQTVLTGFYKPKPPLPGAIKHIVPIGDYGHTLVYENCPTVVDPKHADEAVLLLHGLGSSHAGTYMTTMARWLLDRGVRVFRADLPGAGDSFMHTYLPPHGACYEEIWQVIQHLRDRLNIQKWRVSGVSLGGNLLLKLLAIKASQISTSKRAGELSIAKAIAVAPPIDLARCCSHMERGVYQMYARYFLRSLKRQSILRASRWPQWRERLEHASFRSIRSFDETVTAPLAGFRNAEEYYRAGSSVNDLEAIQVPTVVLLDRHDPIVPAWLFDEVRWSPSTVVRYTNHGGHVGYLHRAEQHSRWADGWIVNELLNDGDS